MAFRIIKRVRSFASSGAILAYVWGESKMPVVDRLGQEFLDYVQDGMMISVEDDGVVVVE